MWDYKKNYTYFNDFVPNFGNFEKKLIKHE